MGNLSSYHGSLGFHLIIAMLPLVRFDSKKLQLPRGNVLLNKNGIMFVEISSVVGLMW
jgi:hypothetical protein